MYKINLKHKIFRKIFPKLKEILNTLCEHNLTKDLTRLTVLSMLKLLCEKLIEQSHKSRITFEYEFTTVF